MLEERKTYYRNGRLRCRTFFDTTKRNCEGEHREWYDNGEASIYEYFRGGMLEGERTKWYENGQPFVREFYRKGVLEGRRRVWGYDGRLRVHEFCSPFAFRHDLNLRKVMSLLALKEILKNRARRRWERKLEMKIILPLARLVSKFLL